MEIRSVIVRPSKFAPKSHFNLMPFGDLQVGSPLFSKTYWAKYTAAVAAQRNVITIGMGDYADHFRPSVQERLTNALGGYDKESLRSMQDMHREFMDKNVVPLLRPIVENSTCLGLLAGHHDMDYNDGTNSTQYLCQRLGLTYLGRGEALIRVAVALNEKKRLTFDIYATHGEGGGATVGTPIGKLQKLLAYFDVDIALRAHSCDKFIFQEPQYYLTHSVPPTLQTRNRIIANTGGFSESRIEGEATYVEKSNMIPKALGWVEIHVHVRRRQSSKSDKHGNTTQYLEMGD